MALSVFDEITPLPERASGTKPDADGELWNTRYTEINLNFELLEDGSPGEFWAAGGGWSVPTGTGITNGHVIEDEGAPLTQRSNLDFIGGGVTAADGASATEVTIPSSAEEIAAASEKTTPVDADKLSIFDSAAAGVLKWLSWSNVKATLKTYFDTFYAAIAESKIVNGAMQVAQQGASATGITASGYPAGGPDLVYLWMNDAGTIDYTQETDTFKDYGFGNSLRIEWTTAKATPSAGSYMAAEWRFAGQDLQDFKKGLTSAEQAAIGFYVEANKTGAYIVELIDDDNSRHVCEAYTVSASTTPQFVEITLPADLTGELDNDENKSMTLRLWFMAGSNYTSGTLATAWATETDANRAAGQVNLADTIANYVEITKIGLYVGATVPAWIHRDKDDVLFDIIPQKWCPKNAALLGTSNGSTGSLFVTGSIPRQMRAIPSTSLVGTITTWDGYTSQTITALGVNYCSENMIGFTANLATGSLNARDSAVLSYPSTDYTLVITSYL